MKCHYSVCRLNSVHRVERTDYSLIIVTQNTVVPCAEIIIFGKYQFSYRFSIEGHKEVEELDKFLAKLKTGMMK
jgi:translation initiation factor IF-3